MAVQKMFDLRYDLDLKVSGLNWFFWQFAFLTRQQIIESLTYRWGLDLTHIPSCPLTSISLAFRFQASLCSEYPYLSRFRGSYCQYQKSDLIPEVIVQNYLLDILKYWIDMSRTSRLQRIWFVSYLSHIFL